MSRSGLSDRVWLEQSPLALKVRVGSISGITRELISAIQVLDIHLTLENTVWISVFSNHIFHLLSVFLVYGLGRKICLRKTKDLPFIAACLHIICPAGVFMSAPCPEPLFSFLNILGFYLYTVPAHEIGKLSVTRWGVGVISAGAAFGLASTVRSNGIFSGALFLFDFTLALFHAAIEGINSESFSKMGILTVGGCLVATGAILPQVVAYDLFCSQLALYHPPWCHKLVPSIYSYVQSRYW